MSNFVTEIGAVYRLPTGRFARLVSRDGRDAELELMDVNHMSPAKNETLSLTLVALGRCCNLAWRAADWQAKVQERARLEAVRLAAHRNMTGVHA